MVMTWNPTLAERIDPDFPVQWPLILAVGTWIAVAIVGGWLNVPIPRNSDTL